MELLRTNNCYRVWYLLDLFRLNATSSIARRQVRVQYHLKSWCRSHIIVRRNLRKSTRNPSSVGNVPESWLYERSNWFWKLPICASSSGIVPLNSLFWSSRWPKQRKRRNPCKKVSVSEKNNPDLEVFCGTYVVCEGCQALWELYQQCYSSEMK